MSTSSRGFLARLPKICLCGAACSAMVQQHLPCGEPSKLGMQASAPRVPEMRLPLNTDAGLRYDIALNCGKAACGYQFLSVAADCGAHFVDMWFNDDMSGRQQWQVSTCSASCSTVQLSDSIWLQLYGRLMQLLGCLSPSSKMEAACMQSALRSSYDAYSPALCLIHAESTQMAAARGSAGHSPGAKQSV